MAKILNTAYINKRVRTKGTGNVNIRASYSTSSAVVFSLKPTDYTSCVTTGYIFKESTNYTWYEVKINNSKTGWVRNDVITLFENTINIPSSNNSAQSEAQQLVNNWIQSDLKIYENVLRSAGIINSLAERNKGVPSNYLKTFDTLNARLSNRQDTLKSQKGITVQQGKTSNEKKYTLAIKYNDLASKGKIGAIPAIILYIAISAVVSAIITAGVIALCRTKYSESTSDLKVSEDLEKALSSLDPQTAEKVKQDLEKQIDDAYKSGKFDGTFGGIGGTIKYLAIGVAGFFAIKAFTNLTSK